MLPTQWRKFVRIGVDPAYMALYIRAVSIEKYMEEFYDSPCINCLVQSMCLKEHKGPDESKWVRANYCPYLMGYINIVKASHRSGGFR